MEVTLKVTVKMTEEMTMKVTIIVKVTLIRLKLTERESDREGAGGCMDSFVYGDNSG